MKKSGTIKVKRKVNNFVQIDRMIFEDARLSYKAKGVIAYLLTKPDGWKVLISDLLNKTSKEGTEAIRNALTELVLTGYMQMITISTPDKGYNGRYYEVSEEPLFDRVYVRKSENRNRMFKENEELVKYTPKIKNVNS